MHCVEADIAWVSILTPGFTTKPNAEFQEAPKQKEASLPMAFYSSTPTPQC